MKNSIQFVLLAILFSACSKNSIDIMGYDYSDAETLEKLETYLDDLGESGRLHGAALVAKDGNVIYEKAFGESHEGNQNSIEDLFDSASIGKNFTAVAIMQLVQEGKLKLADNIRDHLPNYGKKEDASRITIEHLLTHESGIVDIFSYPLIEEIDHESIEEFKEYFPYFETQKLEFKPGKKFSYSNSGYLVLGAIIEAVSQQSFCEYLHGNIFETAGMTNTECVMPMGGNKNTLQDILSFANALYNNELLDEFHTQLATTGGGRITQERNDSFYAYGFQIEQNEKGKRIYHRGGTEKIKAVLAHFPKSGYTSIHYHNNKEVGFEGLLESEEYLKKLFWK